MLQLSIKAQSQDINTSIFYLAELMFVSIAETNRCSEEKTLTTLPMFGPVNISIHPSCH